MCAGEVLRSNSDSTVPPLRASQRSQVSLADFEVVRHVGAGNFSDVFYVQLRPSMRSALGVSVSDYAMKRIDKKKLKRLHKEREALMEKHCLLKLHNQSAPETRQNVVQLYWTFQDDAYLYLILEYCSEGELFELINGIGLLDDDLGRFFVAQLVNALEHCHAMGIVHRDIKAENILFTKEGVLKLIDFGTAIDLERPDVKGAGNRTAGVHGRVYEHFVGTAQFMAPEAVRNQFSGVLSDLWSLGCTIYQVLAGAPCFNGPSDFLTHLLSRTGDLEFPPHFPAPAQDLVRRLLKYIPEERLGANGFHDIKGHPYFAGIDFLNVRTLLGPRLPYPPLEDLCCGHMSQDWNRFLKKWTESQWCIVNTDTTGSRVTLLPIDDSPRKDDERQSNKSHGECGYWHLPCRTLKLEQYSRELLDDPLSRTCHRLRHAQERLLYWKKLNATRDDCFWEEKIKRFMQDAKT